MRNWKNFTPIVGENAGNKSVTFLSSNPSVATVNENGMLRARSAGTSTITVQTIDGSKQAICNVQVTSSVSFVGGDGSIDNPYLISTPEQLNGVREYLDSHFALINDIDLGGFGDWTPIGEYEWDWETEETNLDIAFTGTFDGRGYVVRNMTISTEVRESNGLFGYVCNSAIKNVGIVGAEINVNISVDHSANAYVGGICGWADNSTIVNCYNTGNISASTNAYYSFAHVGGICGVASNSDITDCYNTGALVATARTNTTTVANESQSATGGIIGTNEGSVNNCYNTGDISAFASAFQGSHIFSESAVAGGICGGNRGLINNCYNVGNITSSATNYDAIAGGICGSDSYLLNSTNETIGVIRNCYNAGNISASGSDTFVGGINGGSYYSDMTIENCYWNIDSVQNVKGVQLSNGDKKGVGSGVEAGSSKTTNQMRDKLSFGGFDFTTTWAITPNKNNGYPILRYQAVPVNQNGENITLAGIKDATSISILAPDGAVGTINAMIAFYRNGRLLSCATNMEHSISDGMLNISTTGLVIPQNPTSVKVLVWTPLNTLVPLDECYEIR